MRTLIRIDESKALIAPTREEVIFFFLPPLLLSVVLINMQDRNKALMSRGAD